MTPEVVILTTLSSADAERRLLSKLYKHARTTRNLTATRDIQKHAVEASRLFFWTCFWNPQGKREYEGLREATQ